MKRFKCSKMFARFSLGLFLMGSHAASAMEDGGKLFGTPENAAPLPGDQEQHEDERAIRRLWKNFIKQSAHSVASGSYSESVLTSLDGDDFQSLLDFHTTFIHLIEDTMFDVVELNGFVFEGFNKLKARYDPVLQEEVDISSQKVKRGLLQDPFGSGSNLAQNLAKLGGAVNSKNSNSNEFEFFKKAFDEAVQEEDRYILNPDYPGLDRDYVVARFGFQKYVDLFLEVFVNKKDVIPERDAEGKEIKSFGETLYKHPTQVTLEDLYGKNDAIDKFKALGFENVLDSVLREPHFFLASHMTDKVSAKKRELAKALFDNLSPKAENKNKVENIDSIYSNYNFRERWANRVVQLFDEKIKEKIKEKKSQIFQLSKIFGLNMLKLAETISHVDAVDISKLDKKNGDFPFDMHAPSFRGFLQTISVTNDLNVLNELCGAFSGDHHRRYEEILHGVRKLMDDKVSQAIRWGGWTGFAVGTPDGFMCTEEGQIFSTKTPRREISFVFRSNVNDSPSYIEVAVNEEFYLRFQKELSDVTMGTQGKIFVKKTPFADEGFAFAKTFDFKEENFVSIEIKDHALSLKVNSSEELPNPTFITDRSSPDASQKAANTSFNFSRDLDARITRVAFGDGVHLRLIDLEEFKQRFGQNPGKEENQTSIFTADSDDSSDDEGSPSQRNPVRGIPLRGSDQEASYGLYGWERQDGGRFNEQLRGSSSWQGQYDERRDVPRFQDALHGRQGFVQGFDQEVSYGLYDWKRKDGGLFNEQLRGSSSSQGQHDESWAVPKFQDAPPYSRQGFMQVEQSRGFAARSRASFDSVRSTRQDGLEAYEARQVSKQDQFDWPVA